MSGNEKFQAQEQVLELYDGQLAKLSNKKLIADNIPKLKYTARGKELFALSESCYGKWLSGGGEECLKRALMFCEESVKEGYPGAVVKTGFYYDKDYLATDRTEEFRCRLACDYYCKVIYGDEIPAFADAVTPEISWEELQRAAARMLLIMLAGAPPSLTAYGSSKYSYDENSRRIKERFQIALDLNRQQREERDREKFAETVFDSCKRNKSRAPLFGVLSLKCDGVKRLFVSKSAVMKICGDVNIWLYGGGKLLKANNTTSFFDFVNGLDCEDVWIYFFNNNLGGHKYLNGKQRKGLCELMRADNYRRFTALRESAEERGKGEYLFSDDDVQFFINNRFTPLKSALDGLIEMVISDKGWNNND